MEDANSEVLVRDYIELIRGHLKMKVDRPDSQIRVLRASADVRPGCSPHMA